MSQNGNHGDDRGQDRQSGGGSQFRTSTPPPSLGLVSSEKERKRNVCLGIVFELGEIPNPLIKV